MTSYAHGIHTLYKSIYTTEDGRSNYKVLYDTSSGMVCVGIEIPNETVQDVVPDIIKEQPVYFQLTGNRPEHDGIQENYMYPDETRPDYGCTVLPFVVCDMQGQPIIYKDEEWAKNILKDSKVHFMDGSWMTSASPFFKRLWRWLDEVILTWACHIDHGE